MTTVAFQKICSVFAVLGALIATFQVNATPTTYEFVTGTAAVRGGPPALDPGLAAALNGFSVSGRFDYDSDAAFGLTFSVPGTLSNVALYPGAVSNFAGSVQGRDFADPTGAAIAGDEGYSSPITPPSDFLQLAVNVSGAPGSDFSGFSLLGYDLLNVRLFWIESFKLPELVPDFLPGSDALLRLLPSFNGRLALDFGSNGALLPNSAGTVFFDDLRVRSIPEPASLVLLAIGTTMLFAHRRNRAVGRFSPIGCLPRHIT